jgi:hypothetical protein
MCIVKHILRYIARCGGVKGETARRLSPRLLRRYFASALAGSFTIGTVANSTL